MDESSAPSTCARCGATVPAESVCPECGWSLQAQRRGLPMRVDQKQVMLRDLVIFQIKLFLDGVKDLVLVPVSIGAFLFDILPRSSSGKNFYAVMRAGEKFDLWLNLYDATRRVDAETDGLFGESLAGANNLIGRVEGAVRQTVEVGKETLEQVKERRAGGGSGTEARSATESIPGDPRAAGASDERVEPAKREDTRSGE